jgi:hypothetical protein
LKQSTQFLRSPSLRPDGILARLARLVAPPAVVTGIACIIVAMRPLNQYMAVLLADWSRAADPQFLVLDKWRSMARMQLILLVGGLLTMVSGFLALIWTCPEERGPYGGWRVAQRISGDPVPSGSREHEEPSLSGR